MISNINSMSFLLFQVCMAPKANNIPATVLLNWLIQPSQDAYYH